MYTKHLSSIVAWLFPDIPLVEGIYRAECGESGCELVEWNEEIFSREQPSEAEIASQEKSWAASSKREEIYLEQELRSKTVYGEEISRNRFAEIEEFYTLLLKAAARNPIDETLTPIHWGLKTLRDNRNTALAALQAWVDDPAKTADDILSFDVPGWSGWEVPRP